jgi:hypothetical protein
MKIFLAILASNAFLSRTFTSISGAWRETVPAVPGVPEPLPNWGNATERRGHGPGTGVPGVPALSNSLSPCPVAKSGCNTAGGRASTPPCYSRS